MKKLLFTIFLSQVQYFKVRSQKTLILFLYDFLDDTKDAGVTQAYESVLILTIRKLNDPHFKDFANEVKHRAYTNYNYTFGPTEEVVWFIKSLNHSARLK